MTKVKILNQSLIWAITNLKKIKFSHIPYIIIIILLIVVTCQNGKDRTVIRTVIKTDTIVKYVHIRDTIKGKTIILKGKKDTVWLHKPGYVPKLTYDSLLAQYLALGSLYFHTNVYKTKFIIPDYGYVNVVDTVSENHLFSTEMQPFLDLPVKTITVTEEQPPKRQVYVGLILTGTKIELMNSANVGLLYKDKKDRLFGGSIGVTSQGTQYGVSSYLKLKLRR